MHGDEVTKSDLSSLERKIDDLRYDLERKLSDLEGEIGRLQDKVSSIRTDLNCMGEE